MLTLSVVVAVMGLSADSAAVVIGVVLLAPLMQPVLATAACISMALFRTSLRSLWRSCPRWPPLGERLAAQLVETLVVELTWLERQEVARASPSQPPTRFTFSLSAWLLGPRQPAT
jgi:hypothetical protein